jgi:hypothetical protein
LCIYVILPVYMCDKNVFVMSPCCGDCQILAGSRMQPKIRQVTIGVAYILVMGNKYSTLQKLISELVICFTWNARYKYANVIGSIKDSYQY